jgi:antitoxin component YwqK of YwqJK toxin-antitoxin module
MESWNTYNIHVEITKVVEEHFPESEIEVTYHQEVDRLGLEHGKTIGYLPDGSIYGDHSYVQGTKHGTSVEHVQGGHTIMTSYDTGITHGPSIGYFEDGGVRYSTYIDGVRQGLCRDEMTDGITWADHRDNNWHGLVCKWDLDGYLLFMGFYVDGRGYSKYYSYQYHPNGKLKKYIVAAHGIQVKTLEYDEMGQLIE